MRSTNQLKVQSLIVLSLLTPLFAFGTGPSKHDRGFETLSSLYAGTSGNNAWVILLVGEIRDEQTAEVATHAALTGHLVLSTLHTNDAPSALVRLIDLGVAPYLVASTVQAVLAQRLVRRICPACKVAVQPDPRVTSAIGLEPETHQVYQGTGCEGCLQTGYRERTGIYELLVMTDEIHAELPRHRGSGELRQLAIKMGMRTLAEDGLRLVRSGLTTVDEVLRVTRGQLV